MPKRPVPLWKIQRELLRFRRQVAMVLTSPFDPLARRAYDRNRLSRIKRTTGQMPEQACVAIYLIYQPSGILPSTLLACRFLNDHGFSVHVVSNAPLSDADRLALAEVSSLVLERPNFGYDFGGYRDGILDILDSGTLPDRLLVLNDSIWFPLFDDTDLLEQIRQTPFDIWGPLMTRDPDPREEHIHSYMFSFSRRIMASPQFRAYWRTLFMSNNKVAVISRNEKRMTHEIAGGQFTYSALRDFDDLPRALHALPFQDLVEFVGHQVAIGQRHAMLLEARRAELDDAEWAQLAFEAIEQRKLSSFVLMVHPMIAVRELRLPFLKKDKAPHCQAQRRLLKAMPVYAEINPVIRAEIDGWDGD
ncbi:MAG: rhamnan synthesis F family protein [Paracoccaceae bacterium]